jgi:hypothetical protein
MTDNSAGGVQWRRVATEFLIIVAGVMVALATDRWTGSLDDRIKERTHLEQLLADFRGNQEIARGSASYTTALGKSATAVLEAIKGTPDRNRGVPFPVDVELSGWNHAPHYLSEAWQDLLSTGDVRLIRNPELRSEIARFYQSAATGRDYEEEWRAYVMAYRASVGHVLDPYLRLRILRLFGVKMLVADSLGPRDSDEVITARLRALPDVPGKLTDAIMAHRAGAYRYQNDADAIGKIIELLETEVGKAALRD